MVCARSQLSADRPGARGGRGRHSERGGSARPGTRLPRDGLASRRRGGDLAATRLVAVRRARSANAARERHRRSAAGHGAAAARFRRRSPALDGRARRPCRRAGLSLVATKTPAFSGERPERMNVTFVQLDEEAGAQWVVSPQSGSLPAAMRRFAPFGANLTFPFPCRRRRPPSLPPRRGSTRPAPQAEVIERDPGDAARTSPAARLLATRRPDRHVAAATRSGELRGRWRPSHPGSHTAGGGPAGPPGPRSGFRSYACLTVPPEGVEFVVTLGGPNRSRASSWTTRSAFRPVAVPWCAHVPPRRRRSSTVTSPSWDAGSRCERGTRAHVVRIRRGLARFRVAVVVRRTAIR